MADEPQNGAANNEGEGKSAPAPAPAPAPTGEPPLPEWPEMAADGGMRGWVDAELNRRGLIEDVDTSTLSKAEKKKYKARREQERKVRKVLNKHAWAAFRRAHIVHLGPGIFYHDTADVDRYDISEPETRLEKNALPKLKDMAALAEALELTPGELRWLCYHREVDTGSHYRLWSVPKRDGGSRLIAAPKPKLKGAQRWLCKNVTERLPIHGAAHGFVAGRSTATNAAVHAGAALVVKFDLKDCYPTVTMPRVKGLLRKAGYGEQVATLMAMLCTEAPREVLELRGRPHYVAVGARSLPQGAPTSPSLTNAILLRLDRRLSGLCRKLGFRYTRYADDLTFSWHDAKGKPPLGKLLGSVRNITEDEGFKLHPKKTRVMRAGGRQKVTGLVVNQATDKPPARVPRKYVRRLRAALHNRKNGKARADETVQTLIGMAAYVYMCDYDKGRALLDQALALAKQEASHE